MQALEPTGIVYDDNLVSERMRPGDLEVCMRACVLAMCSSFTLLARANHCVWIHALPGEHVQPPTHTRAPKVITTCAQSMVLSLNRPHNIVSMLMFSNHVAQSTSIIGTLGNDACRG